MLDLHEGILEEFAERAPYEVRARFPRDPRRWPAPRVADFPREAERARRYFATRAAAASNERAARPRTFDAKAWKREWERAHRPRIGREHTRTIDRTRVQALRGAGLSQEAIGRTLGVSQGAISKILKCA